MKGTWIIYKHTNTLNGKVYIGQTCRELSKRCKRDGQGYINCPRFYSAIKKYGWKNFKHEVLVRDIHTQELANFLERFYVNYYKSNILGYNVLEGGGAVSEQPLIALRAVNQYSKYGKYIKTYNNIQEASAETHINERCIESCCNELQKVAGDFCWSYTDKKFEPFDSIMSSKKVYQYSLDGKFIKEYRSLSDAAKDNNIAVESISRCCSKKDIKSCGDYQWSFKKLNNIGRVSRGTNAKVIYQFDVNGQLLNKFNSAKEAYNKTGVGRGEICSCCKHKSKSAGGYYWSYTNDICLDEHIKIVHTRPVSQFSLEGVFIKTWSSLAEIYKTLHIRQGNVWKCCNNRKKSTGGYIWKYASEECI